MPNIQRTSSEHPLSAEKMYVPGVESLVKITDRVKKRWSGESSGSYSTYSPYINVGTTPTGSDLTAIAYGNGEKKTSKVPNGQVFAGRSQGGMTRDKIYGTNVYGSGYISKSDQALGTVTGKSFPSYFWPIDWSTSSTSYSDGDNGDDGDDGNDDGDDDGSDWDGTTWDDNSSGSNNGNGWNTVSNYGSSNGWGSTSTGTNWNNYYVDEDNSTSASSVNTSSNWYTGSSSSEFGGPNNPARPGGALAYATFTSSDYDTTAIVLADNATLYSIINTTTYACGSYLADTSSIYATSFDGYEGDGPQESQAIQYYRASSVVLTVDNSNGDSSYNNYATNSNGNSDNSDNNDYSSYSSYSGSNGYSTISSSNAYSSSSNGYYYSGMVDCLNQTIGASVPLVGSAYAWAQPGHMMGSLSLFWVLGAMLYHLF
ncbi:hypothetical protein SCHPADRAFT_707257 [Schizopora paradoxa]|uniref:Uncharacterized protein n=1 Tax=Schizopora paradoxa TaxID=27342 RepID=A0A0H2R906_9AGAM|nr:hypothetical protein SCHPADRAFT_707257 [Schizopora paradoxa]